MHDDQSFHRYGLVVAVSGSILTLDQAYSLDFLASFFQSVATAKKLKLDHFFTSKMHFVESAVSLVIYGVYADFGSELLRVSKLPL